MVLQNERDNELNILLVRTTVDVRLQRQGSRVLMSTSAHPVSGMTNCIGKLLLINWVLASSFSPGRLQNECWKTLS